VLGLPSRGRSATSGLAHLGPTGAFAVRRTWITQPRHRPLSHLASYALHSFNLNGIVMLSVSCLH
jgi:hypothetical protein